MHAESTLDKPSFPYFYIFLCLVFLKALVMIGIILYSGIGLGPDEAQYWTWSQALDWGYYSKPPGIAWQIWIGTQLFGHTELGVRFMTVLLSIAQSCLIYLLALKSGLRSSVAFWAGVMMAFCPLGILGSLFAITDVGFLLFWTIACLILTDALYKKKEPNPFQISLAIIGGALFKWPIYSFWILFLVVRQLYFPQQNKVKTGLAIVLSLIGLLPSLWWNFSHDWATFRHVSATLQGGSEATHISGNFFSFMGSQMGLMSPILFILFLMACGSFIKHRKTLSPALFWCTLLTVAPFVLLMVASLFQKVQGNWVQLVYPTGFVLLAAYAEEHERKIVKWMKVGINFSVILTVLTLVNARLPLFSFINPFKHNLGWTELQQVLKAEGYDSKHHFLVSDRYQTTSELSFYNEGQKRAYFLNLHGIRNNQFCYWPCLSQEQQGQSGFFVWVENHPLEHKELKSKLNFYENELPKYFERVEFLGLHPLIKQGSQVAKGAFIFRCEGCRDIPPPFSSKY